MTTRNTDKLRREVAAHVAADSITQGIYWDEETQRGCFIGCLAHDADPAVNEAEYGLPVMLQRIAESIFEALPPSDARAFFAALPDAVGCDGKDLSSVGWQFLAAELRSLPPQPLHIQEVIDPVIAGLDLLATGHDWPHPEAAAFAGIATDSASAAASSAASAAASVATYAAVSANVYAADIYVATSAAAAASAATSAAVSANVYAADIYVARLRQRDLLLRLISEAPAS